MKELSKYLVNSLKQEQRHYKERVSNKSIFIDFNNFFKNSGKIEISGKFVRACRYVLPIPDFIPIKNDMSKYKLINRYEANKKNS